MRRNVSRVSMRSKFKVTAPDYFNIFIAKKCLLCSQAGLLSGLHHAEASLFAMPVTDYDSSLFHYQTFDNENIPISVQGPRSPCVCLWIIMQC
jgi:hypothetical protein